MRILPCLFLLLVSGVFLGGCNRCGKFDCANNDNMAQFRIVSAADGKDLLFGPNKIYDSQNIKFYSVKGTDTTFFDSVATPRLTDSVLMVGFFPIPNVAYIRLNNIDTDTLYMSSYTYRHKCCGSITKIDKFTHNTNSNFHSKGGIYELKK